MRHLACCLTEAFHECRGHPIHSYILTSADTKSPTFLHHNHKTEGLITYPLYKPCQIAHFTSFVQYRKFTIHQGPASPLHNNFIQLWLLENTLFVTLSC
uniref:Uncharacterized protein n=1 Tax=Anguilla anguilla TaxID=7936 RepID=A0A0E9QT05_ANGAN